jgi:non-heme chloroperoxidase
MTLLIIFGVGCALIASAIIWGGPKPIAPLASINDPFKTVDFSDLPRPVTYAARDGTKLAYRLYAATAQANNAKVSGSVILIHGSSASSASLHVLAKAYQQAGINAYSLDMRGHGDSGVKGHIDYIGQLEDDVVDFINAIKPARPLTMTGLSAGGGFTLRFAGSAAQNLVDDYVLLAPFISQDDITYRPDSGGWVSVGLPRIVALSILNGIGVRLWNDLEVTRFALNDVGRATLTPAYQFNLAVNFRPLRDFAANMKAVKQPIRIIAGESDESFFADKYEASLKAQNLAWPVKLIPGVGHIGVSLDQAALKEIIALKAP